MNSDEKRVREEYVSKYYQEFGGKYDALVVMVGRTIEPLIRDIRAVSAEKTYLLYTKGSEKEMETIIEECGLLPSKYEKERVNSTDMTEIYGVIKEIARKHDKVAVDITGGKKAMAGAAAIAAAFISLDIIYSDYTEYDKENRRPKRGTEYLARLKNPMKTTQDILKKMGMEAFNHGDFKRAAELFSKVSEESYSAEDEAMFSFLNQMSQAFLMFSSFDFAGGHHLIEKVYSKSKRWNHHTQEDILRFSEKSRAIYEMKKKGARDLEILGTRDAYLFIASLLINLRNKKKNQGDMVSSALINYRLMEMMAQQRLAKMGIDTSEVSESSINFSKEEREKYDEYTRETAGYIKISRKSGLLQDICILKAKEDPLLEDIVPNDVKNASQPRNKSYMEHGIDPVDAKKVKNMEGTVNKMLENFCNIEGISVEELTGLARFPKLREV